MDDEHLDPRVAEQIRSRLMAEVVADRRSAKPARSPVASRGASAWGWRLPVLTSVVVALVVALLSVGVLQAVHPPQPAAPLRQDARMFGGRCAAMLPAPTAQQAVGSALGRPVDVTRDRAALDGGLVAALSVIGGLRCDWAPLAAARGDGSGLVLAAAPAALAPKGTSVPYCYRSSSGGPIQSSCSFTHRSVGVWFSGTLTASGTTKRLAARVLRLERALDASAGTPGAAIPLAARPAGSWARVTDCAALVRSAKLPTVLGNSGLVGESGNGGAEQPAAQTAADRRLGVTPCIVEAQQGGRSGISGLEFRVMPGAARIQALIDADHSATPKRLPSGQVVLVTKGEGGARTLHVADGVNYLQIQVESTTLNRVLPAVEPLLRALDASRG